MWLLLVTCVLAAYLLLQLVRLIRGDADLVVLSKKMKPEYFKGRVVWVTGASSGIGEQLSYQLSKMGAKLVLSTLEGQRQEMERVIKNLANPDDARMLLFNLSDSEATRGATEKAKQLFGRIDILINNAGVSTRAMFLDVKESTHRMVMEINLFGPWILSHDCLKGMVEQEFGHIVFISSIAGKSGHPWCTSYSSAKFGIVGLSDSIRYEMVENKNIHITNVVPSVVATKIGENAILADGTTHGKRDKFIDEGMTAERCAELTLIGCCNRLSEVWVSRQPLLMATYLLQYIPTIHHFLMKKYSCNIIDLDRKLKKKD